MKNIYISIAFILTAIYSQTMMAQAPIKKVLLEEYTTGSCGNCPPTSAKIGEWHESHKDNSIVMVIHEGSGHDAMSNAITNTIFTAMRPTGGWFAPAIMINRGVYPSTNGEAYLSCFKGWGTATAPGIDSIATRLISEPAAVGVNIIGAYNASTRTIDATVNVRFFQNIPSGDWRINLFLVEDSVIGYPGLGPFKGWDQHCYDATWAKDNYGSMFDGTSIIGFPHRHVMRESLLGNWGKAQVIPAIPTIGTLYTTQASIKVDTAYKENHLKLVAFVSSYGSTKADKYVLNANEVDVTNYFSTGVEENIYSNAALINEIYPNPSSGESNLIYTLNKAEKVEIIITDITGNTVLQVPSNFTLAGQHQVTFNTSSLAQGMYIITLKTGDAKSVKKMMVL